jgi:hypothetical protein
MGGLYSMNRIIIGRAPVTALAVNACGGSNEKPGTPARAKESTAKVALAKLDLARIEADVKTGLIRNLNEGNNDPHSVKVDSVDGVTVDVDQSTGDGIWKVDTTS